MAADQPVVVSLKANLEKIIFQAPDTAYFVASFKDLDTRQIFTATGYMPDLSQDSTYLLKGSMVQHKRYGKQFSCTSVERVLPEFKESVITFLSSDQFPGIGKVTAQKIFEALGEDALNKIQADPSVLDSLTLSPAQKQTLVDGLEDYKGRDSVFMRLVAYGLSESLIYKLKQAYKSKLEEVLQENCFLPYYEVKGFTYRHACKIADGMKMPHDDPRRLEALVYRKVFEACYQNGNTSLSDRTLYNECKIGNYGAYHQAVQSLMDRGLLFFDETIYPVTLYQAEQEIAKGLHAHEFKVALPADDLDDLIERIERKEHISYDQKQKDAIREFFHHSIMILNGGPGTGKSTTVKGILDLVRLEFPNSQIQLAAPTGRASKRLAELSDMPSRTIHSLLKYNMDTETFVAGADDPLECDFLIVDEFSMVDTSLLAALLKALPSTCRILMIGDEDQLPSVSPGKVFNDIIDSHTVSMVSLQKLFRQANGSGIAALASQIRNEQPVTYSDGVVFHDLPVDDIALKVMDLIQGSFDPEQTQILAPKYQGPAGIDAINEAMQNLLNPFDKNKSEMKVGQVTFREGDKVLLKKNRTNENVFNGDIGRVAEVDQVGEVVTVAFDEHNLVSFPRKEISENLSHAWCISIHKAQGSEFQHVILVMDPASSFMLDKRLLYTAISRAKKRLDIVGSRSLFESRIRNTSISSRQTGLKKRLEQAWKSSAA